MINWEVLFGQLLVLFFEKLLYILFYPFYLIARNIVVEPGSPETEMGGEVIDDFFIIVDLENLEMQKDMKN